MLIEEVRVGFLRLFTRFGRFMLPRYLFYAVMITAMMITYLIIYRIYDPIALLFGSLACAILWYETIRVLKEIPF